MKQLEQHGDYFFPIAAYEEYASPENRMQECHWHDECEFFCLTQGETNMIIDGIKAYMAEGDIIFIPGGCMHRAELVNNSTFQFRAIVFKHNLLCGFGDIVQLKYIQPMLENRIKINTLLHNKKTEAGALQIFNKLFDSLRACPPAYEIICKAYLLELTAHLFSQSECENPVEFISRDSVEGIKQAMLYIHEHYATSLTVGHLSEIARMSQGHFIRQFKKLTSKSPIDYVKCVRLNYASRLITETNEKLINVALEAGFNNISYFNRCFNDYFGTPPSAYRKLYMKNYAQHAEAK